MPNGTAPSVATRLPISYYISTSLIENLLLRKVSKQRSLISCFLSDVTAIVMFFESMTKPSEAIFVLVQKRM